MVEHLEFLRVVNVALSIAAAAAFLIRINDVWRNQTRGGRALRGGLFALLLSVAFASGESYVQHAPPGWRTPMVTLSCLLVLRGLWMSRSDV